MNYFKLTKHQVIDENIAYTAMYLYKLIDREMYLDELFQKYVNSKGTQLSSAIEKTLLLSLTFLFGLGKINIIESMIVRN
ncbi:TPA: hypothetical protein KRL75_004049 [Clostridioides difficile]|uniref:ABC-three component system middle component 6 n=1 Tax=Clostridioides difficile TaxID=1496 RepID=UPI001C164BEC|nr:ABC-three component system middle component 6 [Clostridioides difficile]MCF2714161.1 hypothetical protein [Clostridioides difficile]HBF6521666.1 hypothetical protein [Clostridioides difficile]HBG3320085.1 hypothetical protein [Clostridioides difficile]HBG3322176.1 hypothetical protein [Clostridioides difficile]HBG3505701.1 hypothetical protein [Clostridioides difficile]